MFLQQTMGPWFAVQRASQVLMIVLAVSMLTMPMLYQPEEAEAWLVWAIRGAAALGAAAQNPRVQQVVKEGAKLVGAAAVGAMTSLGVNKLLGQNDKSICAGYCKGEVDDSEAHRSECRSHPQAQVYYNCDPNHGHGSNCGAPPRRSRSRGSL